MILKNILHLSDFHINKDNKDNFEELASSINDAISNKGVEYYPDLVIVTGDLTESANQDEFKWIREGLQNMLKKSCFNHVEYIMLLAGNHDYSWAVSETRSESFEFLCNKIEKGIETINVQNSNYRIKWAFLNGYGKKILVVGMDSMQIDSPEWPGIGFFSKEQLRKVCEIIQEQQAAYGDSIQVFVAFHHHLVPVSVMERDTYLDPKKFSITLDARRAINYFLNSKVDFAIHGHQHQPSMITWKDDTRKDNSELHIISAGCLAGKMYAGESSRSSFMLYSVCDDKVIINQAETAQFDSEVFEWQTFVYPDRVDQVFSEKKEDTLNRNRIINLAEQDDRWINQADKAGALTIRELIGRLVNSIADDGSVAYEIGIKKRYRTSTLATVLECMADIGLLPKEDLHIMQRKLLDLKYHFTPIENNDDTIEKYSEDTHAWGIDEAPSVWTTSKALSALFNTNYEPVSEEEKKDISESVIWLANQAYENGGWGYQKYDKSRSCTANVAMTSLAMKALSLALMKDYVVDYADSKIIVTALEAGLYYLKKVKVEPSKTNICYWKYDNCANLSASIWALESWGLACKVVHKSKYYGILYNKIKPKVLRYVIDNMPEKEDDEKWTECFFRAKKEDGLKYKPAPLAKDKEFYSFTPYLISFFIKEDNSYIDNPKVINVIKWVLAHREDSWLIEHNYNSNNACSISVAMAINVIINWFKTKANTLIEQETEKLFMNNGE